MGPNTEQIGPIENCVRRRECMDLPGRCPVRRWIAQRGPGGSTGPSLPIAWAALSAATHHLSHRGRLRQPCPWSLQFWASMKSGQLSADSWWACHFHDMLLQWVQWLSFGLANDALTALRKSAPGQRL